MTKEQERILGNVETVFLPHLKRIFEDNLVVVILYGSAVKGTFTDRISDANVLVLLREADPAAVIELGKKARACMRKNRINPLLLTEEEYLASADVFPLEYLDIVESRKVLYGNDPTGKLDITKANLRHQVEAQLRGTIADLRRVLLASRGRAPVLRRYLREWFGSQNALLRGLRRLGGVDDIDAASLGDLARIRSGEKLDAAQTIEKVLLYFTQLAGKIDSMDV